MGVVGCIQDVGCTELNPGFLGALNDRIWNFTTFGRLSKTLDMTSPICWNITLPKTNIAPEKWWFGNDFPFGNPMLMVLC